MSEEKKINPFNESLRSRLEDYRTRNGLTNSEIGKEIGVHATQVSKYINGTPDWDVTRFESVVEDILRNESKRKETGAWLIETSISTAMSGVFETIRETNDMGMIFAPAGIGKTCGCELYVLKNPSAIFLTVTRWRNTSHDIEGMVFRAINNKSWDGQSKRADFAAKQLKNSNRLIIFDNAHKLHTSAREWIFDFHDETGCPIAFVGNPELLDSIRKNDQHFSRIGEKRELKLKEGQARKIAGQITRKLVPEFAVEIDDLAEVIAEQRGHFRSVRKQVILARKLKGSATGEQAVRMAHTQLVRDYAL